MLAIARALMSRPHLLLLDEPSLGLAPLIVKQIFDVIRELNERDGMTVFLVEQNAYHALKLAHRGYVMVTGTITMSRHRQGAARRSGGQGRLSRGRAALQRMRDSPTMMRRDRLGRRASRAARRLRERSTMQGILYEEQSIWLFLLVTVCMGGWAAWMTGRAVAITWRPFWQCVAAAFRPRRPSCASSTSPCSMARCSRCTTTSSTRLVLLIIGLVGFRFTAHGR